MLEKCRKYIVLDWFNFPHLGKLSLLRGGGEKDVLTLSAHGLNSICFSSETVTIPVKIIDQVITRFKNIYLLYDADPTGIQCAAKQCKVLSGYNIKTITLPLAGTKSAKDITDFFRLGYTLDDFIKLVNTNL